MTLFPLDPPPPPPNRRTATTSDPALNAIFLQLYGYTATDLVAATPRTLNVRTALAGTYIYVGRYMPGRFAGHPLGNPFKLRRGASLAERLDNREQYAAWLDELDKQDPSILERLADEVERTGLGLGCWCEPLPCHAQVVADRVGRIIARRRAKGAKAR